MLLEKLLWLIGIVGILFGAGTHGLPVLSEDKPVSHITISMMQADKPMGNVEEGFCAPPKSVNVKKMKVDDILNCAPEKSTWTMSHLNNLKAVEAMILHKDLPGLLSLKRSIESHMSRKGFHKFHKK